MGEVEGQGRQMKQRRGQGGEQRGEKRWKRKSWREVRVSPTAGSCIQRPFSPEDIQAG